MKTNKREFLASLGIGGLAAMQIGALASSPAAAQEVAAARPAAEAGAGRAARGGARSSPAITMGTAPSLPDKAAFPAMEGTYMNCAGSIPRLVGGNALIIKAGAAEAGQAEGFRPDQNRLRGYFAKLINADLDEIAFVPSTSIGESFVAAALNLPEKGAHVVSDHLHFVGAQMMYTDMQKRGVELTWVKMDKNGRIPLHDFDKAIVKGKTRLVAVSGTSMINGFMHDLKALCQIAHAKGAMVHADCIQTVGNSPVDVKDIGIDSICVGTYKWLMSAGTAFLYVKKSSQARMVPPYYHFNNYAFPPMPGMGLPHTHMYPFDPPGKEAVDQYWPKEGAEGMFSMSYAPNTATLAGLEYSLPYIANIGVKNIQAYNKTLIDRLKVELPKRGYPLLTPIDNNAPIVSVAFKDAVNLDPVLQAANVRITTRWNHIRMSPSIFNDQNDVDRVLAALPVNRA